MQKLKDISSESRLLCGLRYLCLEPVFVAFVVRERVTMKRSDKRYQEMRMTVKRFPSFRLYLALTVNPYVFDLTQKKNWLLRMGNMVQWILKKEGKVAEVGELDDGKKVTEEEVGKAIAGSLADLQKAQKEQVERYPKDMQVGREKRYLCIDVDIVGLTGVDVREVSTSLWGVYWLGIRIAFRILRSWVFGKK